MSEFYEKRIIDELRKQDGCMNDLSRCNDMTIKEKKKFNMKPE